MLENGEQFRVVPYVTYNMRSLTSFEGRKVESIFDELDNKDRTVISTR